MLRFLLLCTIVVMLGVGCPNPSDSSGDIDAIRTVINNFWDAYNAKDYTKCLMYSSDVGNVQQAVEELAFYRESVGRVTVDSISDISITGSTATALVTTTIGGVKDSSYDSLKKNGSWGLVLQ